MSDLDLMKQAFMDERCAPELLAYQAELVERLAEQIREQDEKLDQLDTEVGNEIGKFMYKMEMARIKFLLKGYLRSRITKIERFTAHLLDNSEMQQRMSSEEKQYAANYFKAWAKNLLGSVVTHMPEDFKSLLQESRASTGNDIVSQPNLDTHIFCRALEDCGQVPVSDEHEVSLVAGDLYVLRYSCVAHLLQQKLVCLV